MVIFKLAAVPVLAFSLAGDKMPPLPAEITAYYSDYNFVSAHSTPDERQKMMNSSGKPEEERLRQVRKKIESLKSRTFPGEAEILNPLHRKPYFHPSQLCGIDTFWTDRGRMKIRVHTFKLDHGLIQYLISGYWQGQKVDMNDLPKKVTFRSRGAEIHTWISDRSKWKLSEIKVVLVE